MTEPAKTLIEWAAQFGHQPEEMRSIFDQMNDAAAAVGAPAAMRCIGGELWTMDPELAELIRQNPDMLG